MSSELATLLSAVGLRPSEVLPGKAAGRGNSFTPVVQGKQQPQQEERQQGNEEELAKAIENLNKFVNNIGRDLVFSIDKDLGRIVITVTDIETNEVIKVIPSEEALKIAKRIEENKSLLFNEEA